jgi:hypothetical protein
MTLLAGFDMVTEISNATILKLIKKNMKIGGVSLNPPFELTLPFTGGSGHLIVDDVQLDLTDDDKINLALTFSQTSATLAAPISRVVCPLSGTMTIKADVSLVAAGGSTRQIAVNMGTATVAVT